MRGKDNIFASAEVTISLFFKSYHSIDLQHIFSSGCSVGCLFLTKWRIATGHTTQQRNEGEMLRISKNKTGFA
jgi:hypothetical protein